MTTMTQAELDALAQKEADELLANHQTRVSLTPEQIAAAELEKRTLLSSASFKTAGDNGPRARRLASRDQGGPEAPPPGEEISAPRVVHIVREPEPFVPVPAALLGPAKDVDLERVDPIQLAELADAAKTAKKTYLSLQAATDEARATYEAAQARFMAYLQQ